MTGKTNVTDVDFLATDYSLYLIDFPKIAPPISYHGRFRGLASGEIARQAAQLLADRIELEGEQTVAAFIMEPIMGAAAMTVPPPEYLTLVREICDQSGILLITDEVPTGAGRTGAFLAVGMVPQRRCPRDPCQGASWSWADGRRPSPCPRGVMHLHAEGTPRRRGANAATAKGGRHARLLGGGCEGSGREPDMQGQSPTPRRQPRSLRSHTSAAKTPLLSRRSGQHTHLLQNACDVAD
jgi:hypothetical protein